MNPTPLLSLLLVGAVLSGCSALRPSSASHVATGPAYPATDAAEVSVILQEPDQPFTVIGLIESRGGGLTKKIQKDRAIHALKKEAAAIGATAVLITETRTRSAQGVDEDLVGEETVISGKALHL